MTIIEAIKSGKDYRKKGDESWITAGNSTRYYSKQEVLAEYEIRLEKTSMTFPLWVNIYEDFIAISRTKEEADAANSKAGNTRIKCIKVVEVVE